MKIEQRGNNLFVSNQYRAIGFVDNGRIYLQRCPICGHENYALSVSSGQCVWCGCQIGFTDDGRIAIIREKENHDK